MGISLCLGLLVHAIQICLSEGFTHANEVTYILVLSSFYLKGHPILYLEHHFDINSVKTRPRGALVLSGAL